MPSLEAKVDNMPAIDFIHYAMGELLGIEYVVDPSARQRTPVTLSTGGLQSPRQLYRMTMQVLGQNGLSVEVNDGVHYLYKEEATKKGAGVTVNIGRDADVVPNVPGEILQVVPSSMVRILASREHSISSWMSKSHWTQLKTPCFCVVSDERLSRRSVLSVCSMHLPIAGAILAWLNLLT